jgi:hypothetical protein
VLSGQEQAATDVLSSLYSLVAAQAAKHAAWADFAAVLLSPETDAFFKARLPGSAAVDDVGGGGSGPPPKKRKQNDEAGAAANAQSVAVCDHCGGTVPAITLRVACLDGVTWNVTVPPRGLVRDAKRTLSTVGCDIDPTLIDLFLEGTENALLDAKRLDRAGVSDGTVLFMLPRQSNVVCTARGAALYTH